MLLAVNSLDDVELSIPSPVLVQPHKRRVRAVMQRALLVGLAMLMSQGTEGSWF